ncbi:MAG: U32 family peptidase, partial [Methanobrevibacter sp.]|nr:U32 family peptidase [Methanobrevibacter sp.]
MKIPELLAPVGSMEHLRITINAGASSVYLSGKNYGARKFAKNFSLDEIKKAVRLAHLYNVRVYITVNTLIKESELESVLDYLNELYAIGVDAVLIQDLGLIDLINRYI